MEVSHTTGVRTSGLLLGGGLNRSKELRVKGYWWMPYTFLGSKGMIMMIMMMMMTTMMMMIMVVMVGVVLVVVEVEVMVIVMVMVMMRIR